MNNRLAEAIYEKILFELEQGPPSDKIDRLINRLAELGQIDHADKFGLTISMRAAALGNVDVLEATHALGSPLDIRNTLTNANLLHYAAMQPDGGAEIIRWVILEKKASNDLLNEQILVPGKKRDTDRDWDRGNGHTVAFEAVFNGNEEVVEILIEIASKGHRVDFETPALHGHVPLSWALNLNSKNIVNLLKARLDLGSMDDTKLRQEKNDDAREYFEKKDREWFESHENDWHARDLAEKLRYYVRVGDMKDKSVEESIDRAIKENGVDLNQPYGRFGQPLLNLVPTHPDIMNLSDPNKDQKRRYKKVVRMLIKKGADPRTKEKGLMEVSAGFREVFFGFMDALEYMIKRVHPLERNGFVNEVGPFNGYTRLIDASLIGQEKAIELLLEHRPDRNIRGFNGWAASKAARKHNDNASQNDAIPERLMSLLKYKKNVVIITGAGGGLGKGTARIFVENDWCVVLSDRKCKKLDEAVEEIDPLEEKRDNILVQPARITDSNEVGKLIDEALKKFQNIDVLINIAGVHQHGPFEELALKEWDDVLNVNLAGVFHMCKAVFPVMKERGFGYIVNISSISGKKGVADSTAYCASKFALTGFTQALHEEGKEHNIRCSTFYPGGMNTEFVPDLDKEIKRDFLQPEHVGEFLFNMVQFHMTNEVFSLNEAVFTPIKEKFYP